MLLILFLLIQSLDHYLFHSVLKVALKVIGVRYPDPYLRNPGVLVARQWHSITFTAVAHFNRGSCPDTLY